VLAAESLNGIEGEGVISTIKHYSLNCNETNRHWLDAIIDPAAHCESDLLAFEITIERSPSCTHDRLQQEQRRPRQW
jgi:beta-glucosidase